MKTIMQDWWDTKEALLIALALANASLKEAESIIKDRTGQDAQFGRLLDKANKGGGIFKGVSLEYNSFANLLGIPSIKSRETLPSGHIYMSLSEAKDLLKFLNKLNTGWFINDWVRKESGIELT